MIESGSKLTSAQKTKKATLRGTRVYRNIFEELQQRIRQGDWLPGGTHAQHHSIGKRTASRRRLHARSVALFAIHWIGQN